MIDLILEPPGAAPRRSEPPAAYRVGGVSVRSDRPIETLEPYRRPGPTAPLPDPPEASLPEPPLPGGSARFAEPAWLGGRWRPTTCVAGTDGYRLAVEGIGRFSVGAGGRTGRVESVAPEAAREHVEETVLGPVLILALALQGIWCLHASAVLATTPDGTVDTAAAFVGASGHGKSTLALALADAEPARWRHLADDVLPVAPAGDRAVARPRFPQLKLAPERQPALSAPEEVALRAVYVLEGPGGSHGGGSRLRELSRREAALALVRHTVASRLFAPGLLARHLEACGTLAAGVRVCRVSYPWTGSLAEGLSDLLAGDLGAA